MKIIFLLIAVSMVFSSCSKNNYLEDNIAEIRECLYEGKNEDVSVNFVCGKREKDYVLNGFATELIEFGVLTFDIKDKEKYATQTGKYVLTVGTTRYDGDLQKNPFDGTFVADIKKVIKDTQSIRAKIIMGDLVKEIKLHRIDSDWQVSSGDVIKIINKNFKQDINSLVVDGVFKGEVYIKILNDADMYVGDYYWYVSVISRSGGKLNAIISHKTGEILSHNNTLQKVK